MLRFDRVQHRYDTGTLALDGIDTDVAAGEFVSLIGPSGCGKSTLLRLAAGLDVPSAGTIGRAAEARMAFVFQQPTLMPWTSVARNVELPLALEGVPPQRARERAASALASVGLSEFADAYPRELSGGMQMRASIARALVTEPTLLLMDEPFGALDDITRARLDNDLLALASARALTVLFVTHNLHEAVFLSSRVLVMSRRPGRLVAELRVEAPSPRTDAFRTSERFLRHCAHLAGLLAQGDVAP